MTNLKKIKTSTDKKGKILILITTLVRGGCELHLVNTLPEFDEDRFKMEVFIIGAQSGILANDLEQAGVKLYRPWFEASRPPRNPIIRFFYLVMISVQLLYVLIRQRPDIVHCYLPLSYLLGMTLALLVRTPFVIMSRRSLNLYQRKYPKLARVEHFYHRFCSVLLGNSIGVIRDLIEKENADPSKTCLIYNGIHPLPSLSEAQKDHVRQTLNLTRQQLVLCCVANLIPYKGHKDLIDALALIKSEMPKDWRLLLIGRDDGIGERLQTQAFHTGLSDHILFLGSRPDIPALLSISQIGLLCSHEEGFSNAVLEGMSAGLPMIVTHVGGNTEAVHDQVHGFVVPAKNPERLADAILTLSQNPAKRQDMGQAAQMRVNTVFSMKTCIHNYTQLYEAMLSRHPLPSTLHSGFVESEASPLEKLPKTCT